MDIIAISDIVVLEDRQRKDLGDLTSLTASLKKVGQISPIILREGNILVAGERRLNAARAAGWPTIGYRMWETLSLVEAEILELEENIKRAPLTWQEQCDSILKLHTIFEERDPEWTRSKTADELSMSTQHLGRLLMVAEAMITNPALRAVTTLSTAYNSLQRDNERRMADVMSDIGQVFIPVEEQVHVEEVVPVIGGSSAVLHPGAQGTVRSAPLAISPQVDGAGSAPIAVKARPQILDPEKSILVQDFCQWAKDYQGAKYNFIHCDFPYAAGAGKTSGQINSGGALSSYEDSEEIFWKLCTALMDSMQNVIAPSAHIMFWHSSSMYSEVYNFFKGHEDIYDLRVFPIPLIWFKTDNTGVVADPARRPRHVYESALLISRGDRKIVQPFGDCYGAPVSRSIHPAEKPVPMLQHFFRMFVSDTTRMLDPTCGSATSLRAAEMLGAQHVLGFEISEEFARLSRAELKSVRTKKLLADLEKKE